MQAAGLVQPSPCTRPSSSAPACVGSHQNHLKFLQPQLLMHPSTVGKAPGGQCQRGPTVLCRRTVVISGRTWANTRQHALKYIDRSIYKNACASELNFKLITEHLGLDDKLTTESPGLDLLYTVANIPLTIIPFAIDKYDSSPRPPALKGVCKAPGEADKEIKVYSCCPHHLFVLLFTAHLVTVTAPECLWSKAHPSGNKRTFLLN